MKWSIRGGAWRSFRPIIALPFLALVTLVMWGGSSPVGSSPDDDFHLASIWCAAGEKHDICETTGDQATRLVPTDLVVDSVCYRFDPARSANCQGADFGSNAGDTSVTARGNFEGLYPPLFYMTMSPLAGTNVEHSVFAMRILNSIIFVGLLSILFLALPVHRRPALLLSTSITMVPLGLFLVPSVNPSSWAILSALVIWISLVGYFETEGRRRFALGAIALFATVLGAGARADSAVYAGLAIIAAVILSIKANKSHAFALLLPLALGVIAVIFYLSAQQSAVTSTGLSPSTPSNPSVDWKALLAYNLLNVPDLWVGVFGKWGLGWLDTTLPALVWVAAFACFVAFVTDGLLNSTMRNLVAAAVVFAALWLLPVAILMQTQAAVGGYVQPRYLLPLIIILAGISLLHSSPARKLTRARRVLLVGALGIANAVALHTNIRRYVTGNDVGSWNLDAAVEWWWFPISPMTVWLLGSLAFLGVLALVSGYGARQPLQDETERLFGEPDTARIPPAPAPKVTSSRWRRTARVGDK